MILLVTVVLLVAVGLFAWTKAQDYASRQLVDGIAGEIATESGDNATEKVEDLYDALNAEEKNAVDDIISNHTSVENARTVQALMAEEDTQGLREFILETLTPEETAQLLELYEKYNGSE